MDAIDAIMTRRSVRTFEERSVPKDAIEKIIKAGTYAPSALGLQPWAFVVVQDRALTKKISDFAVPILREQIKGVTTEGMGAKFAKMVQKEGFSIFYNAPLLILVLGKKANRFRHFDCALCAENMMLAAHAMGLGSCWIGAMEPAFGNPEILEELQVPEDHEIVAPLIFGYPAQRPEIPEKRDPEVTWIG